MTESKSLVPVEQKEVEFYSDMIVAVRLADGGVYIPIKPVCDLLGVDWGGQYRRVQRDPVLSQEIQRIDVTSTRRGTQAMICLPLDYVSGFLFGLNADRVKPELRERVILYQRECYKVLAEAFQEGRLSPDTVFSELLEQDTDAVQAYKMLQAMIKLARNQILIEARLDTHDNRLNSYENRLEQVELALSGNDRSVTPDQAMQISQAVKAIGIALGKRTKRNEFGGVYGELYRKFGITSYKTLPAKKFTDAMKFLTEWFESIEGSAPF
ncbi:MAG: ORF6C domain-containing protein [Anaerolineales bacterium]|nr:ORF6C domain-containing protein [Anaerolineales bacterium]